MLDIDNSLEVSIALEIMNILTNHHIPRMDVSYSKKPKNNYVTVPTIKSINNPLIHHTLGQLQIYT